MINLIVESKIKYNGPCNSASVFQVFYLPCSWNVLVKIQCKLNFWLSPHRPICAAANIYPMHMPCTAVKSYYTYIHTLAILDDPLEMGFSYVLSPYFTQIRQHQYSQSIGWDFVYQTPFKKTRKCFCHLLVNIKFHLSEIYTDDQNIHPSFHQTCRSGCCL